MKNILKTVVCSLVAVLFSFGLFSSQAWALGDFSKSCYNSKIDGPYLVSDCRTANGSVNYDTYINLNPYIENVDGNLKLQPSNFYETCRNLEVDVNVLYAECKRRDQSWNYTRINLDDHIANIDGNLKYE